MKRASVFLAGLIAAVLVLVAACGGEEAAATPRPAATKSPAPTATKAPAPTVASTVAPAAGASLEISVKGDALEFTKTSLSAQAGAAVVLTFNNVSAINQHNWVIVQAGAKDAVATRGLTASTTNWVQPGDAQVIANTPLVDPGKTGEVRFAAPPAGLYQFVCTFPGHNFTMFGDFEVTP